MRSMSTRPKDEKELGQITHEQLRWLLSGLQVYPKSYFKDIEIKDDKINSIPAI